MKDSVLGLLRHILTFAGGVLVTKGLLDESSVLELSGALVGLIGVVWSIVDKLKKPSA